MTEDKQPENDPRWVITVKVTCPSGSAGVILSTVTDLMATVTDRMSDPMVDVALRQEAHQ